VNALAGGHRREPVFGGNALSFSIRNISRLPAEQAIYKIDIMKITKSIGMILLAVYLIVDGLLGFGLNIGPAIFLLYLVALSAGIFILIGK
jgi:hypothetical protein